MTPNPQSQPLPDGRKILIRFGSGTMRAWLPAGVTPASINVRDLDAPNGARSRTASPVGAPTAAAQPREVI